MIVARVRTSLTRTELRDALVVGYFDAFDQAPSYEDIGVGWAQGCLEHANGHAIYCFNVGNVDALPTWEGDVFELTAAEMIRGRRVMRTKRLCAFADAASGAAHFWARMRDDYGAALPYFEAGDPEGAARKLKELKYFTGIVSEYAEAMRLLYRDFERAWPRPRAPQAQLA